MDSFDRFFCKFYPAKSASTAASATGLGVGGAPRRGVPKTEAERLATHQERYLGSELPPRGTGLSRS